MNLASSTFISNKPKPLSERQLRLRALERYGLQVPKKKDNEAPAIPVPDQATATAIASFCKRSCEEAVLQGILIKGFKRMPDGRKWVLLVLRRSPQHVGKRGAFMNDPAEEKRRMALECRPFLERIGDEAWASGARLLHDFLHKKRGEYTTAEWLAAPFCATFACDPTVSFDEIDDDDDAKEGKDTTDESDEKEGALRKPKKEQPPPSEEETVVVEMKRIDQARRDAEEKKQKLREIKDIAQIPRDVFHADVRSSSWVVQIHNAQMAERVRLAFLACLHQPREYRGGGMVWHAFRWLPGGTVWAWFEASPAPEGTPSRFLSFASSDEIAAFGGIDSRGFWHVVWDARRAGTCVQPLEALFDPIGGYCTREQWDKAPGLLECTADMFDSVPVVEVSKEEVEAMQKASFRKVLVLGF